MLLHGTSGRTLGKFDFQSLENSECPQHSKCPSSASTGDSPCPEPVATLFLAQKSLLSRAATTPRWSLWSLCPVGAVWFYFHAPNPRLLYPWGSISWICGAGTIPAAPSPPPRPQHSIRDPPSSPEIITIGKVIATTKRGLKALFAALSSRLSLPNVDFKGKRKKGKESYPSPCL